MATGDETPKALLREKIRGLQEKNEELERLREELQRQLAERTEQLLQGQKLQALGQLSAALAHEINNPVSFILVNLALIEQQLPQIARKDAALHELESILSDCKVGATRIHDLVKNLREFARVDEGELRPTDLHQVLETSLKLCWNEIKQHATVERRYGRLQPVPCHPQRMSQVFVNLLLNASQAIEEAERRGGMGEIDRKSVV